MTTGTALFDLSGKTALVTGASQGIGFALARGLAEAGAKIVLNGRDTGKLAAAAENLRSEGHAVDELAFDATDNAAVKAAIDGYEDGRIPPVNLSLARLAHLDHRDMRRRIRVAAKASVRASWDVIRGRPGPTDHLAK